MTKDKIRNGDETEGGTSSPSAGIQGSIASTEPEAPATTQTLNEPEAAATTMTNGSSHKSSGKKKHKKKSKSKSKSSSSSSRNDESSSSSASHLLVTEAGRTNPSPRPSPRSTNRLVTNVSAQQSSAPMPQIGSRLQPDAAEEPDAAVTTGMTSPMQKVQRGGGRTTPSPRPSPTSQKPSLSREEFQAKAEAAAASARPGTARTRPSVDVESPSSPRQQAPSGNDDEFDEPERADSFRPTPGAYAMEIPAPVYIMGDDDDEENPENEEEPIPEECMPQTHPRETSMPQSYPADAGYTGDGGEIILDAEVHLATQPFDDDYADEPPKFFSGKGLCIIVGAVLLVVIVVIAIVLAVTLSGGGGDSSRNPDDIPDDVTVPSTPAPSTAVPVPLSPTPPPTREDLFPPGLCFDKTIAIVNRLRSRPLNDDFVDVELCEGKLIRVDRVDRGVPYTGLFPPLLAQSNMRYKCGSDGAVTNRCRVYQGESLVLNTFNFKNEVAARNVTFEGITFESGLQTFMELTNAGDLTFKNCVFRSSKDFTPIIINYQDEEKDPSIRQTVTFESCIFEEMKFGSNNIEYAENYTDFSTIIMATHPSNTVILRDCDFRIKNPGDPNTANININSGVAGYLVASLGAEIRIENTCFRGNSLGSQGSPILLGTEKEVPIFSANNNYVEDNTGSCPFVTEEEPETTPSCGETTADATECLSTMQDFIVYW